MALPDAARKAMFASLAGTGPRPGAKLPGTGPALPRAPRFTKGSGPMPASYAEGGPVIQTQASRFMKTPDQFRENVERQDYGKTGKTGEMSNTTKDKSLPPIKPRT